MQGETLRDVQGEDTSRENEDRSQEILSFALFSYHKRYWIKDKIALFKKKNVPILKLKKKSKV